MYEGVGRGNPWARMSEVCYRGKERAVCLLDLKCIVTFVPLPRLSSEAGLMTSTLGLYRDSHPISA